ncbi:MAG: hypothetical protein HC904_09880 [Blastochloris sp.]|nr:hypothetical protein [Blastochloris sp.]
MSSTCNQVWRRMVGGILKGPGGAGGGTGVLGSGLVLDLKGLKASSKLPP